MAVIQKYQSLQRRIERTKRMTSLAFEGNEGDIDSFIGALVIGGVDPAYGTIVSIDKTPIDAGRFQAKINYSIEIGANGSSKPAGSATTAERSQLSCKMLQLPIEAHRNYRAKWNYHLISLRGATTVPDWWNTATTAFERGINPGLEQYAWVKELPNYSDFGGNWRIIAERTKKSNVFDYPVYELREYADHNTMEQAGWVMTQKAGKISVPINGDFGIVAQMGGNWLCEGGDIGYDGRYWVAGLLHAHSPDGWDLELYDEVI